MPSCFTGPVNNRVGGSSHHMIRRVYFALGLEASRSRKHLSCQGGKILMTTLGLSAAYHNTCTTSLCRADLPSKGCSVADKQSRPMITSEKPSPRRSQQNTTGSAWSAIPVKRIDIRQRKSSRLCCLKRYISCFRFGLLPELRIQKQTW